MAGIPPGNQPGGRPGYPPGGGPGPRLGEIPGMGDMSWYRYAGRDTGPRHCAWDPPVCCGVAGPGPGCRSRGYARGYAAWAWAFPAQGTHKSGFGSWDGDEAVQLYASRLASMGPQALPWATPLAGCTARQGQVRVADPRGQTRAGNAALGLVLDRVSGDALLL